MDTLHHGAIPVCDIAAAVDRYAERFELGIACADDSWAILRFENITLGLDRTSR